MTYRACVGVLVGALAWAGCAGEGSDLGPEIQGRDDVDFKVTVRDDSGRAIVGALVSVDSSSEVSATLQSGRAEFLATPAGAGPRFTVDGSQAAAAVGDALATLTFVSSDRFEVPFVVHLPDVAPSDGLVMTAGTQPAAALDDTGSSGAIVTVPAGTSAGFDGAATAILRTGGLASGHLPPLLREDGQPVLATRGAFVAPGTATYSPGLTLSLPNDLGLAAGATADLYFLNPTLGVWQVAGAGAVDGSGTRIEAPTGVTRGGLYAFAVPSAAATTIRGRVLTLRENVAVSDALVRVDQSITRTFSDGTFVLENVAAVDASGAARAVTVEYTGGRRWWPISGAASLTLAASGNTIPEQILDTMEVGSARVLMVTRGREDGYRRVGVSHNESTRAVRGTVGPDGRIELFDVEQGVVGVLSSLPFNRDQALVTDGLAFLPPGRSHFDLNLFSRTVNWTDRADATQIQVVDDFGGGGIFEVAAFQGFPPNFVQIGFSRIDGRIVTEKNARSIATAIVASGADGEAVTSAFSMVDPVAARIEIPLERARRHPLGAFQPFGMVGGSITSSAGAGRERRLRTTPVFNLVDWYDEVFFDETLTALPVETDPGGPGGTEFLVGGAVPRSNIAVAEGTVAAGRFTLERLGVALGRVYESGRRATLDLDLGLPVGSAYTARGAARGLDAAAVGSLTFDLGAEFADGRVADVARDVAGNVAIAGDDLVFDLPQPGGDLAGASWIVALDATSTQGGVTQRQQGFVRLSGTEVVGQPGFLGVPQILFPAPGATVSDEEFDVQFRAPDGANYIEVELRSDQNDDVRVWKGLLPVTRSSFTFKRLSEEVPDVLVPGRTYTLTVRASRITTGILTEVFEPYFSVCAHYFGLHPADRAVDGMSSQTITVQT